MQEPVVFLVRVQCRRKESSRSLSHLLMSFLFNVHTHSAHCDVRLFLRHTYPFVLNHILYAVGYRYTFIHAAVNTTAVDVSLNLFSFPPLGTDRK